VTASQCDDVTRRCCDFATVVSIYGVAPALIFSAAAGGRFRIVIATARNAKAKATRHAAQAE